MLDIVRLETERPPRDSKPPQEPFDSRAHTFCFRYVVFRDTGLGPLTYSIHVLVLSRDSDIPSYRGILSALAREGTRIFLFLEAPQTAYLVAGAEGYSI
jgi:hypothetical protein